MACILCMRIIIYLSIDKPVGLFYNYFRLNGLIDDCGLLTLKQEIILCH